ncbi:hypothetical protein ACF07D_07535 [Leucobacter sp. NPDC015123]|uniref:hypothetical protein n=1 Tax=Leucobacter sp. NPDC015123 TaxID=3364129 RepID=UPI0036F45B23
MINPTPEQIEAAAKAMSEASSGFFSEGSWRHLAREALAAAGSAPRRDDLVERIADTLAYYQCRETNPKADDPRMGYHSFSEEQRAHLRERKAEAAAEIVRMFAAAAGAAPQEPSLSDAADALRENAREIEDAQLAAHGMIDPITNAVIAGIKQSAAMVCELAGSQVSTVAPVQVDEAKLTEAIADELETDDAVAENWSSGKLNATAQRLVQHAVLPVLRGEDR